MAAHPDQPGQVVAVLDPAGVGGTPAVAQQQGAGVTVGDRLRLGRFPVDLAVLVEADMAVRVDQPGTTQPLATVSAPACGSRVIRPSTT